MHACSLPRTPLRLLVLLVAVGVAALLAPAARGAFLDQCPCRPTDLGLLATFVYPGAPAMTLAPDPGVAAGELEEHIQAELAELLEARSPSDAARGLAVFADPLAVAKVPDPRLRAALALLVGTKAEAAVDAILDDSMLGVMFYDLPLVPFLPGHDPVPVFAQTESLASKYVILLNRRYQNDHFALLSPFLVHEALHVGDPADGRPEEVVNALLGNTFVTAELLADHPEIVAGRTELSRWLLTFVTGLLFNSETPLEARGEEGLAPGSPLTLPGLYPVWYPPNEDTTPGNPLLRSLLQAYGLEVSGDVAFSEELLAQMDIDRMRQTFLSDDELRRIGTEVLALDLDMTASGDVVRTTRKDTRLLVHVEADETLELHATLSRGARVVAEVVAAVLPGRRAVALRLPRGATGKHTLEVELTDAYDNAASIRRTVRLASR
jgi:hypothetical protein